MPIADPSRIANGGDRRRARATAERLIAETRRNSVEYGTQLANHLPMLLEIQFRLGASAERLEHYAEIYNARRNVQPAPPPQTRITSANWQSALGDRRRETDLRAFFTAEVGRLGAGSAIRLYVPVLARGIGASALHGLMRLAYGVLRRDDAEIGTALGYWAMAFLPLRDEPQGEPDTDDPLELAAGMQRMEAFRKVPVKKSDLLWHWMRAVGAMDEFAPVIGRLQIGPGTLDRITQASARLFASAIAPLEGVHAMTGAWWVRLVGAHADDRGLLARYFWQAILAVYPKIDLPTPISEAALEAMRALQIPAIEAIAAATIEFDPLADDEEHHASAVFTAIQEYARTGDPLYLVLAAKRIKLID